ncbi:peptidylprolyl isomerase SurA [Zobellella denitrificans]|jgi:peptidyl-prolyl cis-trans isomerase SurA|uniref:Chaperone SurA n=1 Tax=Zobellella denitrificans TaxID=347534 RepID=A0A231MYQ3_9GAMM|nr:peptidylprolyl isomerase SurA [Zobellella denitrificans]ATG73068.1 peptidylprolyl isomerase [Zobellella denitrificans]OXS14766.1 peptidylprolyl isomerase SurA [Zobellella denitrificans]
MKKRGKQLLIAAGLVLAAAASQAVELLDKVVAVVNQDVVLESQLSGLVNQVRQSARAAGQPLPEERQLRKQALDRLILESLQLQLADRLGLRITDTQLEQAITNIARSEGKTVEQLRAGVAAEGLTYAQFREQVRNEILLSELARNQVRRRINISDQEVKQVVQMIKEQGQGNSRYRVGNILLPLPANPSSEQLRQASGLAEQLMAQLKQGADFRQLAIAHSAGPKALEGGDWGMLGINEMPSLFSEAVRNHAKGDIIGPIRSGAGLHILTIFDMEGGTTQTVQAVEVKARHILIKPSIIMSEEKAQSMLAGFSRSIRAGEASMSELAEQFSEDPGSAINGGDLGWAAPEMYVSSFRDTVNRLDVGQLSEPFRSEHGWHLVLLEDRRVMDATEQATEQRAYQLIFNRRFTEEVQTWLDELRDEAYIRIVDPNLANGEL